MYVGLNEFDLAQQNTKQNYVYTNPDKDTTLRRGDKVFCLATKPIRSFENPLAVRVVFETSSSSSSSRSGIVYLDRLKP